MFGDERPRFLQARCPSWDTIKKVKTVNKTKITDDNYRKHWLSSRRTPGPIYVSYDVFPHNEVPFGGLIHTAPHVGGQAPKNLILGRK